MRLFIALNIPTKEREKIGRAADPLRERDLPVRWVGPDEYHVTLKFLGDVRPDGVEGIHDVLDKVGGSTAPFRASVQGFGAFPTIRRPSVLWAGVTATPELRCLKQDLEWDLAELGFERETRAFHPHVTLGRAGRDRGAGAFRGLDELAASLKLRASFPVKTLDLMRSQPGKDGPRYTLLYQASLRGDG